MLNNKGQSLVLFILVIPILFGIMALVIDVGNALIKKNEMENIIEFVIGYGLDHENEVSKLEKLLDYNLDDCDNSLKLEDGYIVVSSNTYVEGVFSNLLDIKGFRIESTYKGSIEQDKKNIEKIK